jgi:hypothetical protein
MSSPALTRPGRPQLATVPPSPYVLRRLLGTPLGMPRICSEPGKCSLVSAIVQPGLHLTTTGVLLIKGNPAKPGTGTSTLNSLPTEPRIPEPTFTRCCTDNQQLRTCAVARKQCKTLAKSYCPRKTSHNSLTRFNQRCNARILCDCWQPHTRPASLSASQPDSTCQHAYVATQH